MSPFIKFYFTSSTLNTLVPSYWYPCCRLQPATRIPIQPNHTETPTHRNKNNTTNVVIEQNSRQLLMMDILMSETCWAHKKWNKIASGIKLVFYSSTVCNERLENYRTVWRSIICAIRSEFSVRNGEQSTPHFITHGKPLICCLNIRINKKQIIQKIALIWTPSGLHS